jgi:hypothetical protein
MRIEENGHAFLTDREWANIQRKARRLIVGAHGQHIPWNLERDDLQQLALEVMQDSTQDCLRVSRDVDRFEEAWNPDADANGSSTAEPNNEGHDDSDDNDDDENYYINGDFAELADNDDDEDYENYYINGDFAELADDDNDSSSGSETESQHDRALAMRGAVYDIEPSSGAFVLRLTGGGDTNIDEELLLKNLSRMTIDALTLMWGMMRGGTARATTYKPDLVKNVLARFIECCELPPSSDDDDDDDEAHLQKVLHGGTYIYIYIYICVYPFVVFTTTITTITTISTRTTTTATTTATTTTTTTTATTTRTTTTRIYTYIYIYIF